MPGKKVKRIIAKRKTPAPATILAAGIRVFESRHQDSFSMTPRQHHFPELLYFFDGCGQVQFGGHGQQNQTFECAAGDCVIVPINTDHSISDQPGSPLSLYGLAIDPQKIAVSQPLAELLPTGKIPRERLIMLDIESRVRRLLFLVSESGPISMLSAVAEAIDLLACLAEPKRTHQRSASQELENDEIDGYLNWLNSHFFESLTLEEAASVCGMSRRKFTQSFKDRTGSYVAKLSSATSDQSRRQLADIIRRQGNIDCVSIGV